MLMPMVKVNIEALGILQKHRTIVQFVLRLSVPVHPMLRRRRDFPFSNQLTADFARLLSDPGLDLIRHRQDIFRNTIIHFNAVG